MQYGTKFDDTHSTEWGIQQTAPAEISEPDPDLYLVKVPGADAPLDLSEAPTGRVTYGQRKASIPFVCRAPRSAWPAIRSKISSEIHGQKKTIVFDDDPDHFWEGRTYLEWGKTDEKIAFPEISAKLDPFKWDVSLSVSRCSISKKEYVAVSQILEGVNVSQQSWNTDLRFGTKTIPTYDFSKYDYITIFFKVSGSIVPNIQLVDGDGSVLNLSLQESMELGYDSVSISIEDMRTAGLDPATIWRVLATSCVDVRLTGATTGVSCKVYGGVRTREIVVDSANSDLILIYGGREWTMGEGRTLITDIDLNKGENVFLFKSRALSESSEEIKVTYRRGWL